MAIQVEDLNREDLIKVVAKMHDTIQTWSNGWGFSDDEAETLDAAGDACVSWCVKTDNWMVG